MSTIVQAQTLLALEPLEGLVYLQPHLPDRIAKKFIREPQSDNVFEDTAGSRLGGENDEGKTRALAVEVKEVQNALVVTAERKYQLTSDFPVPEELGADEVMIRNRATGLNHIDWKSVDYNFCLPELPWITGREMAGVVERVGSHVTNVKEGDHVWTSKQGAASRHFRSC